MGGAANAAAKKQPIRRCTGCGEHFQKNMLARVVRTPEGEILFDTTGKKSGRGAYLCKSVSCLKKARKGTRLEVALECQIPETVYSRIEEEIAVGE